MTIERGDTFTEGIDIIIKRDLDKHKDLLEGNILSIQSLQRARSNEIARKRFYGEQKGKRRYRDDAMDKAIEQMNKNIGHLSIQIKLTEGRRDRNTFIVDTLTKQLEEYNNKVRELAKYRLNGNRN
jgi:hypothetical protein